MRVSWLRDTNYSPLYISLSFSGLENSQSKQLYEKNTRIAEKLSGIAYCLLVKVTTLYILLPKAMWSYYTYSTSDLGPDAFELAFQMW